MTRASVVVPTRNRAALLARCLRSLDTQTMDPDAFEVIVVDNGSSDGTRAVVERATSTRPTTRYAFVGQPGVSDARNTGIELARGRVVAFIDDDAVAAPGWLAALAAAHDRWPEAGGVGGRTHLWFPVPKPSWLHEDLATWYSARDLGDEPRLLDEELPWTVNASVRRDVARAVGGFDTQVGQAGRRWLFNEDLDFFARVRGSGHPIGYEPAALVVHEVDVRRLSRWWLARRAFAQGRSEAMLEGRKASRSPSASDAVRAVNDAVLRGWRGLARGLRDRQRRGAALADDVVRRGQRLGYAYASFALLAARIGGGAR